MQCPRLRGLRVSRREARWAWVAGWRGAAGGRLARDRGSWAGLNRPSASVGPSRGRHQLLS